MWAASVLLLACALGGVPGWQQTPPRDTPPPSAARTASVSGRVTDKETGQPIHRATVQLTLPTAGARRVFETWTDADGRYEFPSVPAGEYSASASPGEYRSGYQTQSFAPEAGVPLTGRPPLALQPGEVRTVDFALPRAFAIEGRVLNEYGDPLADVTVTVERIGRGSVAVPQRSDDRGHFRLYGLAPAAYRVCGGGDGPVAERVSGGEVLQTRYVRTCVPGTEAVSGGVTIASADVAGITIQMQRAGAFTVSGQVVNESGAPLENGSVQVYSASLEPPLRSGYAEFSRGNFVARGLTPGNYAMRAMAYDADAFVAGPSQPREVGYFPVRVDAADVRNVVVVTRRGVDVAGHVVFEGERPPTAAGGAPLQVYMRFDLETLPIYRMEPAATTAVKPDRTFEMSRVRGPRIVGLTGLATGWLVKSVRYRGADITDVATDFTAGVEARELEIVATNRTARVAARVVDASGQTVEGAVAFLIPVAPHRWKAGPVSLPSPRAQDGAVLPRAILPGDYFLAALPSDEYPRMARSLDVMKAVTGIALRVRVAEEDSRMVDVPLSRIPGAR